MTQRTPVTIDTPLGPVTITPSRDEAHRQERWTAILKTIAALPETEQREATELTRGLLVGLHVGLAIRAA
jgi:hypothetical protein